VLLFKPPTTKIKEMKKGERKRDIQMHCAQKIERQLVLITKIYVN